MIDLDFNQYRMIKLVIGWVDQVPHNIQMIKLVIGWVDHVPHNIQMIKLVVGWVEGKGREGRFSLDIQQRMIGSIYRYIKEYVLDTSCQ